MERSSFPNAYDAIYQALTQLAAADSKILPIEKKTRKLILDEITPLGEFDSTDTLSALDQFKERPLERRMKFIQLLWVLAECDGELHPQEEAMIYRIADKIGVSRMQVARTQPDLRRRSA